MTEGRKSFLEHFAGIESGEACARWEPVLSQIVDGEAAAEIVVEARAHLRHCPSCRATLRRLRVANTSLAAVLPGAAGAGALHDDLVDAPVAAGGFAGRLWDAVVGFAHDRAAAGAVRAQAVIDAASSHKLAAVAASAAAVAGGGVAVEDAVRAERPVPRVTTRAAPPRTQPVRATPVHVAWRTASSPVRSEPVRSSTGRPATGTRRRSARASAARMRRVVRTSAHRAVIRTTAPPPVRAVPPPSEPLVDPVESPAAAPAQAATTPAVAPSRRSPSAATPSQPSAGTEFGFEAP